MLLNISEAANIAMHAMTYLANHARKRPVAVAEIAEHYTVSKDHLNKVLQRLKRAGLVKSTRGPRGGFRLAKPAEQISLLTIYESIDGPLVEGHCLMGSPMCQRNQCILGDLIGKIHAQAGNRLAETVLSQLVED